MNYRYLFHFLGALFIGVPAFAQQTAERRNVVDGIYDVQDSVMVPMTDGALLSAMVVRKKGETRPMPVILQFTIYVRDKGRDLQSLKESADRGYVGVIAYTRGKRFSAGSIYPYESDGNDAYEMIDWISRQSWCNGSVGMYGGSYNGFTQWAATKKLHPALKTIVPYVANRPGMGLPMENNIFINPNYEWSFYVGNNKYLDDSVGNNRQRFREMMFRWWETGVAYNKMDSIDGTPNPLFQRWISHPDFDAYWQHMAPYGADFALIKIPVLAFDGYYNDSQNSGMYYLKELNKFSPGTPAYLVIGPYSHFGTQVGGQKIINGYEISDKALFPIKDYTYQWFDYILKGAQKPAFLKDRINYQVMGTDEWRSAPSLDGMHNDYLTLYLSTDKTGKGYSLTTQQPKKKSYLKQQVDLADRKNSNNDYYPDPIIRKDIYGKNGYVFVSRPLDTPIVVNGSFLGRLVLSINKRDIDVGITLYEVLPNGAYFHLAYYIGRASYAADITHRQLLTPGKKETISFDNTHLVSKLLQRGSRLAVVINVNKNPFSQINYGTGKDVSTETINDAGKPLQVRWYNESFVKIPIWK